MVTKCKDVRPIKINDMNLNREDFGKRSKATRKVLSTPMKIYNPLVNCEIKPLTLHDIRNALKRVIPNSVLYTGVPKPKIDFLREILHVENITDSKASIDDGKFEKVIL